jgi:serine/alanine adding enzyme
MIRRMSATAASPVDVWVHTAATLPARLTPLRKLLGDGPTALSRDPAWLFVLRNSLRHEVYVLEARTVDGPCGFLPLAFVDSMLFGRFLVSLPYLNSNGLVSSSPDVDTVLIDRAVALADELGVRHLELRQERAIEHAALSANVSSKVHMRLSLPATVDGLWKGFDTKVRNQIRKGEKSNFAVRWGGAELLEDFYSVVSRNMRDLGTPVYSHRLFESILTVFPGAAELCVVADGHKPIAAALLLHGPGVTEVPTASSLREYNPSNANMLMYRHLLDRAVGRGQAIFDFGRSTTDGPTFKFKKQWGAEPHPAVWQYYVRCGQVGEMRPDNPRYQQAIRVWQRLPVRLTQWVGPGIVRGIP